MPLQRAHVLGQVDSAFPDSPFVLTLGGTAREMREVAGAKPNHLISLDAMGQTLSIGLGVSLGLGRRSEKVVVLEGDGSLLMGFSVMTTIGNLSPTNLVVLVLDNGVYLSTGGQPTASNGVDLVRVALACGWRGARDVETTEEVADALRWAADAEGPLLIRVRTDISQISTEYILEDPVVLADKFRQWLVNSPSQIPSTSDS